MSLIVSMQNGNARVIIMCNSCEADEQRRVGGGRIEGRQAYVFFIYLNFFLLSPCI